MSMIIHAIGIEFIGTHYKGWQRQQEVDSIQARLEYAISKVANEPVEVIAAGRTDAGVHAGNMVAHFATTAHRTPHQWLRGVNTLLPDDIALTWVTPMPDDFHARFGAIARRYRYITLNQPYRPAILRHQVTHFYEPLDVNVMVQASQLLLGTHDFSSFRSSMCQSNKPVRDVHHIHLFKHGAYLVLDIQADGFLHHMVRNIMGTLFAVGTGRLHIDALPALIDTKDRSLLPPTADADGLYFINAYYPDKFQQLLPKQLLTPLWLGLLE
ncbi:MULTISPECIES: tRNA pseudouridine(38-40) synthase TruA [Moraxella]|uniref:tRNA pseudouridine synthase A n=1 Tax=Moraxella lacunata TaxID=477 RepID=A0A1B8PWG3_MORLA|nr:MULTISPECIES: tRNA pseudouridine(38-40) synthase TruA [Moraxella]MBE9577780.1 tRNA pseudouridine(38-40) synthase TruA [Moraxella sp. K1664]MBE9587202.1 tRNA pseudouridine(38-40) synthase TruA [Moraxella sp. K1630]MBE9589421.1 tRNA pseudouridine(38-40) synthase TruA [Moraxella sp. K127]MBE9595486.1 tRNA pseudouridine(38-40) synthase TruA [Moraxella sp. K2450]MDH9217947.1 tRNA pseudouridine(38-40) synthase TruA [Moraxella lacunata]